MTTTMTMMMPTMMPMPTTYKYNNQIMTEAETYYDIFGYNYNIASSTTSSSSNNDDETTTKTNKKRSTFDYAIRKSEYSIIKDHDESRGTKRCKSMKESPLITIAFIATTATTPTTTTLLLPEEQEQEQEQEESSSSTTTITTAPPAASPASPAPEEEPVSVPSVPSVPSTTSPWVYADDTIYYHETQDEGYYCGRHALNNVLQNNVFTDEELYQSAFDIVENAANAGIYEPLDEHCSDKGMFSIDVLKHATSKKLGVELEYYNNVNNNKDVTSESSHHHYHGYLCNVIISDTMKHWIAIREIGGKYYLLDSLNDKPIMIKNNDLQTTLKDIQKKNGTVFCLPKSN